MVWLGSHQKTKVHNSAQTWRPCATRALSLLLLLLCLLLLLLCLVLLLFQPPELRAGFLHDLDPEGQGFPDTLGELADKLKAWRNRLQVRTHAYTQRGRGGVAQIQEYPAGAGGAAGEGGSRGGKPEESKREQWGVLLCLLLCFVTGSLNGVVESMGRGARCAPMQQPLPHFLTGTTIPRQTRIRAGAGIEATLPYLTHRTFLAPPHLIPTDQPSSMKTPPPNTYPLPPLCTPRLSSRRLCLAACGWRTSAGHCW